MFILTDGTDRRRYLVFIAAAVVSSLLAAALAYTAIRKLGHRPDVVQSYVRVGVREERLNLLAYLLLAGAAGLIGGLFFAPLGLAAAGALIVYFVVAIAAHIRADDEENLPTPIAMELTAVAALVLRAAA
jgi:DoxX-like family